MTTDEALMEHWRDLRNDARHKPAVSTVINFAYEVDLLTLEQRELWLRGLTHAPAMMTRAGARVRVLCDMPASAETP